MMRRKDPPGVPACLVRPARPCPRGGRANVRLRARPTLLALCVVAGLVLPGCGNSNRAFTVGTALAQARETNQVVLVQFWGASRACWQMDRVLEDPLVRRDLEDFVIVRMNYAFNRSAANNLGVAGSPGFAALRPDGSLIAASSGLLDSDRFRQFLVRARIFR